MRVKVRFLSDYRILTGMGEVLLEMPEGATVGSLLDELCQRFPRLGGRREDALVSVNKRQAPERQPLNDGDEAVIFSPAVGG